MKEVLIDRTQFLDICNRMWDMLKPENEELKYEQCIKEAWFKRYSYNSGKIHDHIIGKEYYPDCACGRACLRLEDAVEAFMQMDDLSVLEMTDLWEHFGKIIWHAIGIPNHLLDKYRDLPKKYEKKFVRS